MGKNCSSNSSILVMEKIDHYYTEYPFVLMGCNLICQTYYLSNTVLEKVSKDIPLRFLESAGK